MRKRKLDHTAQAVLDTLKHLYSIGEGRKNITVNEPYFVEYMPYLDWEDVRAAIAALHSKGFIDVQRDDGRRITYRLAGRSLT